MVLPLGGLTETQLAPQDCKVGAVYGRKLSGATFDDMDNCLKSLGRQYYRICDFMPLGETTCEIVTRSQYKADVAKKSFHFSIGSFVKQVAVRFGIIPPIYVHDEEPLSE